MGAHTGMVQQTFPLPRSGDKVRRKRFTGILLFAVAIWCSAINEAHAYLDPGTGSFFLQLLIGSIAGGLICMKTYWAKLAAFFGRHQQASIDAKDEES